jgi:hypothetical protein
MVLPAVQPGALLVTMAPFASTVHLVTSASATSTPFASKARFHAEVVVVGQRDGEVVDEVRPSAFSAAQPMAFKSSSRVFFRA